MKIKVCGITALDQLQQLQKLGVDYAGLIFYAGSKRFVGEKTKNDKAAIKNSGIKKVGVFVNADIKTVIEAVDDYGLYAVQLHGDETNGFCTALMNKVKVIKVFRIADQKNIDELIELYQKDCHYFLFDTDTASFGGSGNKFDWNILKNAKINKSFFLSGGIGPGDVEKINQFQHPHFFAVDINSKFEIEPGNKDMNKVQQFINALCNG